MLKRFVLVAAILMALGLFLAACAGETQTVEVTRVVTETVTVEGQEPRKPWSRRLSKLSLRLSSKLW